MKKSRFTDSQIAEALKRVEAGVAVPELRRFYMSVYLASERQILAQF